MHGPRTLRYLSALALVWGAGSAPALAQTGGLEPIGTATGGELWTSVPAQVWPLLDDGDWLGRSGVRLGDLDGDGQVEFALGAPRADPYGAEIGAVYRVSVNSAGQAVPVGVWTLGLGGFGAALPAGTRFGCALAALDDLDGNGVPEVAVGARFDGDGGAQTGAVWILFLDAAGDVIDQRKLSAALPMLAGVLDPQDRFGAALAWADTDGDGSGELFVGAPYDDAAGPLSGAVWRLELDGSGDPVSIGKWGAGSGGFSGQLDSEDLFGRALARLGDLDGDGRDELAVGAFSDDDGGVDSGAVWICFGASDGTVAQTVKWSATGDSDGDGQPGPDAPFPGDVQAGDHLGRGLAGLGDVDGDGRVDLAVGADWDDASGVDAGAVWVCRLGADGRCEAAERVASGNLALLPTTGSGWGYSLADAGDLNGDGVPELLVGMYGYDGLDPEQGALQWVPFAGVPASVEFGCAGVPGSLLSVAGGPALGETWTVAVDDPTASATPGALVVGFLGAPPLGAPAGCGLPLPGVGALGQPFGVPGEALFDPFQPFESWIVGAWNGAPLPYDLSVPMDPGLVGFAAVVQAALVDGFGASTSRALWAVVGP